MSDRLALDLMKLLASSVMLYIKTSNFHWNVEGKMFKQFHDMFGEQYEEIQSNIDLIAEKLRMIGYYSPGSLSKYIELSVIQDCNTEKTDCCDMVKILLNDHDLIINHLNQTFSSAEEVGDQAIMDFISARLDSHKKHRWMLFASSKE